MSRQLIGFVCSGATAHYEANAAYARGHVRLEAAAALLPRQPAQL